MHKKTRKLIKQENLLGFDIIGITNNKYTLIEVENNIVDELVRIHHYSHKPTKNRFTSFLINENKGFMQLGYGIRPKIKHLISSMITMDNYCEFDRMWLSDDLPKFAESQCISLLLEFVKIKYPKIKFIITYADGSVGNTGIIYKATNAIAIDKLQCDFYLLPNGERIHPVSMYHRHKTRAWQTISKLYPGIKHIKKGYYQYRYLYILDKKIRKKFEMEKISLKS
jgi:hypothetical protein